jgi:CRP-like cAMP-binding protein
MGDADVDRLLARPEFSAINPERFPKQLRLRDLLANDTRIVRFKAGDIVVREGDYGNSAFLILEGKLRVVLAPGLPSETLGRQPARRKSFREALAQLWTNRRIPEVRVVPGGLEHGLRKAEDATTTRVFLQDVPAVLDAHKTAVLEPGGLFGELAALGRVPRTAAMFAETDAELLGSAGRACAKSAGLTTAGASASTSYRANALKVHLRATPLFAQLDEEALQQLTRHTLFETYGASIGTSPTRDSSVRNKRAPGRSRSSRGRAIIGWPAVGARRVRSRDEQARKR